MSLFGYKPFIVCVKHEYLCQLGITPCPECKEEEE